MNSTMQIVLTVLSSGAFFTFIQFLIQRKDSKEEDNIDKKLDEIEKTFQKGLEEREKTGKNRYDEHHNSIEKINIDHKKDFMELQKAILKLTENDAKITENIKKISDQQDIMAESLLGSAHNRILTMTDKIAERNAITLREKATISSMYGPYKKLGGNGIVKESVEYAEQLKVVSEEEAREMDFDIQKKMAKKVLGEE